MADTKYIFVVGGVMSGVGKGVASSSIGKILQMNGLGVSAIKIDPYVNVDAGTMNPTEHGEVFVMDDGTECDQDMGNYERFLDRDFDARNYMTTGSIYLDVIQKERNLEYKGKFVSVVPYIPLEVIGRIERASKKDHADVVITEIGGTVGEYENILFLEAVRMLKFKHPENVLLVLVSYLPTQGSEGELKTKPTQHAVRSLHSAGIHPDVIIARADVALDKKRKEKIAFHCSIDGKSVISAPNVESIYEVPINFEKERLGDVLMEKLNIRTRKKKKDGEWRAFVRNIRRSTKEVRIGIVGKYFATGDFVLTDSYISVIESIKHAAYKEKRKPIIEWLDAEEFDKKNKGYRTSLKKLEKLDGIIVPGGFGSRGIEGKIQAVKYCREHNIPYLGLCYGMQMMVVEFARNVAKIKEAHTTEINAKTPNPVIDVLPEQKELLSKKNYGGTMRLGAYPARLQKGTIAGDAYGKPRISERHRHRYEVNPKYIKRIERAGLIFSGASPDRRLMEIAELPREKHPFFVGSQFHPEFKSRPLNPHPLFRELVKAGIKRREGTGTKKK
ncbi:CTP synthetase [bacterium]|nr:CTP synthetase [bacterium]|tara:strand:- start:5611 stop:7284 length:1674 start_codon:yes stop_codon:yes gene_type:complete